MRKRRLTESQIVQTLKQVEGGRKVKDICRELGMPEDPCYRRKSKHGGTEVSDVLWSRELVGEKRRLMCFYAELALENTVLKRVMTKKAPSADAKRRVVTALMQDS